MIEFNGIYDARQIHSSLKANRTARKAEAVPSAQSGGEGGVDIVKISPEAAFRSKLEAAAKPYARQMSEGISPQRLESLKQQYQGDLCPTTGADIARAMLTQVFGWR